jgi:hypothetical protein
MIVRRGAHPIAPATSEQLLEELPQRELAGEDCVAQHRDHDDHAQHPAPYLQASALPSSDLPVQVYGWEGAPTSSRLAFGAHEEGWARWEGGAPAVRPLLAFREDLQWGEDVV